MVHAGPFVVCRRVPTAPDERWAFVSAWIFQNEWWISEQYALVFGETAGGFGWDEQGEFIRHVACRLLHLPMSRYVDDLFWVLWQDLFEASHSLRHRARQSRARRFFLEGVAALLR